MKITIESTTRIVEVNGVPARVWEGTSEAGIPVAVMVTRIAVDKGADATQFDRELQEHKAPSPAARAFPLRMVL
jgi:hypothetical protein